MNMHEPIILNRDEFKKLKENGIKPWLKSTTSLEKPSSYMSPPVKTNENAVEYILDESVSPLDPNMRPMRADTSIISPDQAPKSIQELRQQRSKPSRVVGDKLKDILRNSDLVDWGRGS